MKSPRTTIAGIMTILGTLITYAAKWIATGVPPSGGDFAVIGSAIATGLGLIAAADGRNLPPGAP